MLVLAPLVWSCWFILSLLRSNRIKETRRGPSTNGSGRDEKRKGLEEGDCAYHMTWNTSPLIGVYSIVVWYRGGGGDSGGRGHWR